MAYRYARRGYYAGLHGQIKHRITPAGRFAHRKSRQVFRKSMQMPKVVLAKTYANTVGQIAYREYPRKKPMHSRFVKRRFVKRRRY